MYYCIFFSQIIYCQIYARWSASSCFYMNCNFTRAFAEINRDNTWFLRVNWNFISTCFTVKVLLYIWILFYSNIFCLLSIKFNCFVLLSNELHAARNFCWPWHGLMVFQSLFVTINNTFTCPVIHYNPASHYPFFLFSFYHLIFSHRSTLGIFINLCSRIFPFNSFQHFIHYISRYH